MTTVVSDAMNISSHPSPGKEWSPTRSHVHEDDVTARQPGVFGPFLRLLS
jgi:hypothetical protein